MMAAMKFRQAEGQDVRRRGAAWGKQKHHDVSLEEKYFRRMERSGGKVAAFWGLDV